MFLCCVLLKSESLSDKIYLRSIASHRWAMVRSACFLFLTKNTFSLKDMTLLLIYDEISYIFFMNKCCKTGRTQ